MPFLSSKCFEFVAKICKKRCLDDFGPGSDLQLEDATRFVKENGLLKTDDKTSVCP